MMDEQLLTVGVGQGRVGWGGERGRRESVLALSKPQSTPTEKHRVAAGLRAPPSLSNKFLKQPHASCLTRQSRGIFLDLL